MLTQQARGSGVGRWHYHQRRWLSGAAPALLLVVLSLLAATTPPARGDTTWYKPPNCTKPCDDQTHQCVSDACLVSWDTCPDGLVTTVTELAVDNSTCSWNPCEFGGCVNSTVEVAAEGCWSAKCIRCQRCGVGGGGGDAHGCMMFLESSGYLQVACLHGQGIWGTWAAWQQRAQ